MKATKDQKEYMKKYYKKNKKRLLNRRNLWRKNHLKQDRETRYDYFIHHKKECYHRTNRWNRKRFIEICNILGNKCNRCGYDNIIALEVHHKDRSKRKNRKCRDYLQIDYDLNKIELICANCHKLEHYTKNKTNKNNRRK